MKEDGFEEVQNLVIFNKKVRVESPVEKKATFSDSVWNTYLHKAW